MGNRTPDCPCMLDIIWLRHDIKLGHTLVSWVSPRVCLTSILANICTYVFNILIQPETWSFCHFILASKVGVLACVLTFILKKKRFWLSINGIQNIIHGYYAWSLKIFLLVFKFSRLIYMLAIRSSLIKMIFYQSDIRICHLSVLSK